MVNKTLKNITSAAGALILSAGMLLQPCVFATEVADSLEAATEITDAEEIPEAETENGPSEDEVTMDGARDTVADDDTEASDEDSAETAEADSTEDAEAQGQTGDTIYSVGDMDRTNAIAVNFKLDVPEDMTYPCIVTFTESESYTEYYVEAYKTAGYQVTAYLEPGTYIITDGYPTNDNISAYTVVDKGWFEVSEDTGSMVVNVTIRSKGDILRGDTGNAAEDDAETETAAAPQAETAEKKDNTLIYIIAAALFMVLGIGIGIFGMKHVEHME